MAEALKPTSVCSAEGAAGLITGIGVCTEEAQQVEARHEG